ncbi:MAG: XRE family transcriptional regulator [Clostridiales bacterium]|nr:XRE family transcriptional regulator [Clostridiales bacterium]MCF8021331.1 XRE family transcriptional regulator [Clostridiales bacterium]
MNLGIRIKKIRLNNNFSVRKLAGKIGVTASFIYQLEQNKVSPSFTTLKNIATNLNTSISLLVEEKLPEEWIITRHDNRRPYNNKPGNETLTPLENSNKKMQPVLFHMDPGDENKDINLFNQEEEEEEHFFFVLKGQIKIMTINNMHALDHNDAAYFIFDSPISIINNGSETAEVLWVISPPQDRE